MMSDELAEFESRIHEDEREDGRAVPKTSGTPDYVIVYGHNPSPCASERFGVLIYNKRNLSTSALERWIDSEHREVEELRRHELIARLINDFDELDVKLGGENVRHDNIVFESEDRDTFVDDANVRAVDVREASGD